MTYQHRGSAGKPGFRLEHRFSPVFVAFCAYVMRRFGTLSVRLQRINECAVPDVFKFIALLLSIPAFKVSHFFFKLAYSLDQRRLLASVR